MDINQEANRGQEASSNGASSGRSNGSDAKSKPEAKSECPQCKGTGKYRVRITTTNNPKGYDAEYNCNHQVTAYSDQLEALITQTEKTARLNELIKMQDDWGMGKDPKKGLWDWETYISDRIASLESNNKEKDR